MKFIYEFPTLDFKSIENFEILNGIRMLIIKPRYLIGEKIFKKLTIEYKESIFPPTMKVDSNLEADSF